jgi:hypothetical protein
MLLLLPDELGWIRHQNESTNDPVVDRDLKLYFNFYRITVLYRVS